MINAVLFDMDGVLMDSFEAWASLVDAAARDCGHPPVSREAVRAVYGVATAQGLLEVSGEQDGVRVRGLGSPPDLHRANRSDLPLLVNRLPIQNRSPDATVAGASAVLLPAVGPRGAADSAKASTPYRRRRPCVGFRPTTPQAAAGNRIDPPVSLPKDPKHSPAAVATPEPLDDAPAQRWASHGLTGISNWGLYPAMAPSVRLSLPSSTAPAASSLATTVASNSGTWSRKTAVPPMVGTPLVKHRSLTAMGMPWSGLL